MIKNIHLLTEAVAIRSELQSRVSKAKSKRAILENLHRKMARIKYEIALLEKSCKKDLKEIRKSRSQITIQESTTSCSNLLIEESSQELCLQAEQVLNEALELRQRFQDD